MQNRPASKEKRLMPRVEQEHQVDDAKDDKSQKRRLNEKLVAALEA